jgi:hypothetical protein
MNMTADYSNHIFYAVRFFIAGWEVFFLYLRTQNGITSLGRLAEWLGSGLQNRVRRFESATDLNKKGVH